MNKPSDEQLREIGEAAQRAWYFKTSIPLKELYSGALIAVGRAAFEASCRIALASPEPCEIEQCCQVIYHEYDILDQSSALLIAERVIRLFRANRLRSLTAQSDPAVEAVRGLLGHASGLFPPAETIVAAVDAARAKK